MPVNNSLSGFLLTRSWRDTPQGIQLVYWVSTPDGPAKVVIENQQAVCFIRRDNQIKLPNTIQRKAVKLKNFEHDAVDALYFQQQRELNKLRDHLAYDKTQLFESEIKPTERYLMERFITASLTINGQAKQRDAYLEYINPQLKPADYSPDLKWVSLDIETSDFRGKLYSIAVSSHDTEQVFTVFPQTCCPRMRLFLNDIANCISS